MPMLKRLLIVDGDQPFRQSLACQLAPLYRITEASCLQEAHPIIKSQVFDLAITELKLGDASGLDMIKLIQQSLPMCRVMILTAAGSISSAVEAMRLGAIDYQIKPLTPQLIEACLLEQGPFCRLDLEKYRLSLDEHEQNYIEFMMLQSGGNVSQAARLLGLHRQSLQRMLKRVVRVV